MPRATPAQLLDRVEFGTEFSEFFDATDEFSLLWTEPLWSINSLKSPWQPTTGVLILRELRWAFRLGRPLSSPVQRTS